MGYPLYEKVCVAYEYDFDVDGGAVSSIALRSVGVNGLPANCAIVGAKIVIETALASSSGAATIGDGTDDDGFFLDLVGTAAGAYSVVSALGGALLVDQAATTPVALEDELGVKLSAAISPELVVTTGALTAGKFKLIFDVIQFA